MDYEAYEQRTVAHRLLATLSKFWSDQGYKFKASIVPKEGNVFEITSNLGPTGFPPRA